MTPNRNDPLEESPLRKYAVAIEWQRRIVNNGWLKVLSAPAQELAHILFVSSMDRVACLSYDSVRKLTGRTRSPVLKSLGELVAYDLVERLVGEKEAKVVGLFKGKRGEACDLVVQLLPPPKLTVYEQFLLDDARTKGTLLLVLTNETIKKNHFQQVQDRMEKVRSSGMSDDILWTGIYTRLLNLLKERKDNPRTTLRLRQCLDYLLPKSPQEVQAMNQVLGIGLDETTVCNKVWSTLNHQEQTVVKAWETHTGRGFLVRELPLVTEALRYCLPSQLVAGIRKHCDKAEVFEYLMPIVKRGGLGRRPANAKEQKESRSMGRAVTVDGWQEQREKLRERALARHA